MKMLCSLICLLSLVLSSAQEDHLQPTERKREPGREGDSYGSGLARVIQKYPEYIDSRSAFTIAFDNKLKHETLIQPLRGDELIPLADEVHGIVKSGQTIEPPKSAEELARIEMETSENERLIQENIKRESVQRALQINANAWELVRQEFPHYMKPKSNFEATVNWMRDRDEYNNAHDPVLAKNPARPIIYARERYALEQAAWEADAPRREAELASTRAQVAAMQVASANEKAMRDQLAAHRAAMAAQAAADREQAETDDYNRAEETRQIIRREIDSHERWGRFGR